MFFECSSSAHIPTFDFSLYLASLERFSTAEALQRSLKYVIGGGRPMGQKDDHDGVRTHNFLIDKMILELLRRSES